MKIILLGTVWIIDLEEQTECEGRWRAHGYLPGEYNASVSSSWGWSVARVLAECAQLAILSECARAEDNDVARDVMRECGRD